MDSAALTEAITISPYRQVRRFSIVRFARRKPLGAVGVVILGLWVVTAVGADIFVRHDPNVVNVDAILDPPSWKFWLGTDDFGRDVLSRVIFGGRISLYVAILSVGVASTVGGLLGMLTAYFGGYVDLLVQRLIDSLMAFPALILAIVLVAVLGASLNNLVIAIGIVLVPQSTRVVRAEALRVREEGYVEASRAVGAGDLRILVRHVMPNVLAPYLIIAVSQLSTAIITEASLSFLGLGIPPPTPSWGGMLSGGARTFIEIAPWMALAPGIALMLIIFSMNMLGDAIRDVWDPRLRR